MVKLKNLFAYAYQLITPPTYLCMSCAKLDDRLDRCLCNNLSFFLSLIKQSKFSVVPLQKDRAEETVFVRELLF